MSKGRWLSDREKGAIDAHLKDKKTRSELVENVGRSRCAIVNYIKKNNKPGTSTQIGRPKKLTPRAVRAIVNVVRTPGMTERKAMVAAGVNASLKIVQRALAAHDHMKYCHLKKRVKLEPRHIKLRFDWAKKFSWCKPKEWRRKGSALTALMDLRIIGMIRGFLKPIFLRESMVVEI